MLGKVPLKKRLVDELHAVVIMAPGKGKRRDALMSSMASATHLFVPFSRERFSIHPEYRLVPVNVLQNRPEAEGPQCTAVSKAKSPGFTVFRSKWVCTGTWDRREAPAARVVLVLRSSRAFRSGASSQSVWALLIFISRALCSSLMP
jgi:hypothetical protein